MKRNTPRRALTFSIISIIFSVIFYFIAIAFGTLIPISNAAKTKREAQQQTSKTPDPTAGWTIYTDNKLGYSIKYPSDKFINLTGVCNDENDINKGVFVLFLKPQKDLESACNGFIPPVESIGVASYSADEIKSATDSATSASNINIGGIAAKEYYSRIDCNDPKYAGGICLSEQAIDIIINRDGGFISIYHYSPDANKWTIPASLFNQILSTFTFITESNSLSAPSPTGGQNSTIDTSTWKTYSDQYLSFSYPPTWDPTVDETPSGGVTLEELNLNIPDVIGNQSGDDNISFSGVDYASIKPADAISTTPITISGRSGTKWLRGNIKNMTYDYYTNGNSTQSSFGVHVLAGQENKALENQLDTMVKTIVLK